MARIIVVGAGMAGLAAAARLATRDNSVLVCEASQVAGGALGSWQYDDLVFDTGAHTLTLPAAYRDLFIKTGSRKKSAAATLEERVDLRPLDPVRRYVFPDGTGLDLPNASRGRLLTAFDDALGTGAGTAWLRVIDHGSQVWDAIRPTFVEAPGSGDRDLTRMLRTRTGRRALTPRQSLRGLAGRWFKGADRRLFLVLDDYARQAGADPRRASAALAARPYVEHAFGAWRIAGGMHGLASALRQRVLDRGAEIRYGARVATIETSGTGAGAVSGVLLESGERVAADVVVAAVDVAVLEKLVGGGRSEGKHSRSYSPGVTTLCLAVEDPPEMAHETVLLDEHGPAIRIHVAAEQPRAWTVHVPQGVGLEVAAVLSAIEARGFAVGVDGRDTGRVRVLRVITAADRAAATGVPGGAAYGPAADSLRSALLRSPIAQPTPGLFHVGASARPGSGLSFAALSGWQAAELIKAEAQAHRI